jgi:hypothetical protein
MPRIKNRKITAATQAVSAFIAGILITFSQSHSAAVGMIALALISLGWAAAFGLSVLRDKKRRGIVFRIFVGLGSLAMLALSIAQLVQLSAVGNSDRFDLIFTAWLLIGAWGFFGTLAEVILAIYAKPGSSRRRDHLISAVLATGLGVSQSIAGLSDSVSHVGFLGAYAIFVAVHLGISVASPTAKADGKKTGSNKTKSKK